MKRPHTFPTIRPVFPNAPPRASSHSEAHRADPCVVAADFSSVKTICHMSFERPRSVSQVIPVVSRMVAPKNDMQQRCERWLACQSRCPEVRLLPCFVRQSALRECPKYAKNDSADHPDSDHTNHHVGVAASVAGETAGRCGCEYASERSDHECKHNKVESSRKIAHVHLL